VRRRCCYCCWLVLMTCAAHAHATIYTTRIQKQKLLLQARHAEEAKIVQPAAALDAAATATAASSDTHDQSGHEGTNQ